ncbi:hypothetical protein COE58_26150 [Bacillus cereus]|nr:hypothetical protein COE58_26150 [Bacillus cereus]
MTEVKKGAGLLSRKTSNFDPINPYAPSKTSSSAKQDAKNKEKKDFKNQKGSIKISNQSKKELEALMKLTNTKFHYEVIDLLIEQYVENELTSEQKHKFNILVDL